MHTQHCTGGRQTPLRDLLRVYPSYETLCIIFNRILLNFHRVPDSWKTSRTILIHTKADPANPRSWRPISLLQSISKIFFSLINNRPNNFLNSHGILSPEQKGFRPTDGILEHDFTLRAMMEESKKGRKDLSLCFLDFENAFGSLPHDLLSESLTRCGLLLPLAQVIMSAYEGATTEILT